MKIKVFYAGALTKARCKLSEAVLTYVCLVKKESLKSLCCGDSLSKYGEGLSRESHAYQVESLQSPRLLHVLLKCSHEQQSVLRVLRQLFLLQVRLFLLRESYKCILSLQLLKTTHLREKLYGLKCLEVCDNCEESL